MKLFDEAKELVTLLRKASDAYYNDAESIITDAEFDQKKDRLVYLYEKVLLPKKSIDPITVKEVESFLTQIGAPVTASEWKKAKHKTPMTSLNKVNSEEDFVKWTQEIGDTEYVVMEKLDGISLDLEYENGCLVKAITRGNGEEGEEVTQNVKKMQYVKEYIKDFTGNLRGEILLTADQFEIINQQLLQNNQQELKNLRNAAAGIAKRLDGKFCEKLSVFYYDCLCNIQFKTFSEKVLYIEALGIKTCFWKLGSVSQMIDIFNEYQNTKRITLNHWIDGLVIVPNNILLCESHGMLGGNPKAKIAWKFEALIVKTKLLDINWHLGNSRRITPVIKVVPVNVCGVTITNINIYNYSNFEQLKLYKGCEVLIKRSNDVIPVLVGVA